MSGVSDEASTHERVSEFPRFLNRERAEQLAQPPPLPRVPWRRGVGVVRAAIAGAASLSAIAVTSAALMTAAPAPNVVEPPPPARDVAVSPHDDVADAVAVVAAFESRLGFGVNMPSQYERLDDGSEANGIDAASQGIATDSMASMMLHPLPEAVAFPSGSIAAQSLWVAAAPDDAMVALSLGDGGTHPVITDADTLARAGLTINVVEAAASSQPDVSQTAPVNVAAIVADEGNDEEAKPAKRRYRAHIRKALKMAGAEPRPKRRIRRNNDAFKARSHEPSVKENDPPAVAEANEPEKPAGPISKFFAWLKSGANKTGADGEKPSALGLAPQE